MSPTPQTLSLAHLPNRRVLQRIWQSLRSAQKCRTRRLFLVAWLMSRLFGAATMRHLMATVIMNILPRSCFVRPSLMIGRHDPPRSGFVVTNCTSLCYLEFHFIRLSLLHLYTFIVYIQLLSTIVLRHTTFVGTSFSSCNAFVLPGLLVNASLHIIS